MTQQPTGRILDRILARSAKPPRLERSWSWNATLIVESIPVLSALGALVGLRFLDQYLSYFQVEVQSVAGFSDYMFALTLGLAVVAGTVLVALLGVAADRRISGRWNWALAAAGWLVFVAYLFDPIDRGVSGILSWLLTVLRDLPFDVAGKVHDYGARLFLTPLYKLRDWTFDPYDRVGIILFLAPVFSGGMLLGRAIRSTNVSRWVLIGVFGSVFCFSLYVLAGRAGLQEGERRSNQSYEYLGAVPVSRTALDGDPAAIGLPSACACGANLVWAGERGTALTCPGTEGLVVIGAENLSIRTRFRFRVRYPMWEEERQYREGRNSLGDAAPRVPVWGHDAPYAALAACAAMKRLDALFVQSSAITSPVIQIAPEGWEALLPEATGRGAIAIRCLAGHLFIRDAFEDRLPADGRRQLNRELQLAVRASRDAEAPGISRVGRYVGDTAVIGLGWIDERWVHAQLNGRSYDLSPIAAFELERGLECLFAHPAERGEPKSGDPHRPPPGPSNARRAAP